MSDWGATADDYSNGARALSRKATALEKHASSPTSDPGTRFADRQTAKTLRGEAAELRETARALRGAR